MSSFGFPNESRHLPLLSTDISYSHSIQPTEPFPPGPESHAKMTLLLLPATSLLFFLYYLLENWVKKRAIRRKYGCKAPPSMNETDKLLGTDGMHTSYRNRINGTYLYHTQNRFAEHGNTYEQRILGSKMINTCDPEIVKAILATQFEKFSLGERRKQAFVPLLGHGIFTTDGQRWNSSRRLLKPSFMKHRIGDVAVLEQHVGRLIDVARSDQLARGYVNLIDLFFTFTLDVATELFFGESSDALRKVDQTNREDEQFANAFNRSQRKIAEDYALGSFAALRLRGKAEFNEDRRIIHEFVDTYVERAVKLAEADEGYESDVPDNEEPYIVLKELAKHTKDTDQLRADLLNLMVAGRDTTASLLSNLWFVIARRPDIWSKLQEEVATLDGTLPDFRQLKELKYLQWCLRESLRLHPAVPINSRTATSDVILPRGGGPDGLAPLHITANTVISYNIFAMHRRPDLWDDADDFKPERWEGHRAGWEYLPFNGGPRICLGQPDKRPRAEQLALTEAGYCTVRLMQHFAKIRPLGKDDWMESLTLTCCPDECNVSFGDSMF